MLYSATDVIPLTSYTFPFSQAGSFLWNWCWLRDWQGFKLLKLHFEIPVVLQFEMQKSTNVLQWGPWKHDDLHGEWHSQSHIHLYGLLKGLFRRPLECLWLCHRHWKCCGRDAEWNWCKYYSLFFLFFSCHCVLFWVVRNPRALWKRKCMVQSRGDFYFKTIICLSSSWPWVWQMSFVSRTLFHSHVWSPKG